MWGHFGGRDLFFIFWGGGGAAFHSWYQAAQCVGPALDKSIAGMVSQPGEERGEEEASCPYQQRAELPAVIAFI